LSWPLLITVFSVSGQKKWVFGHFYFKSGQPESIAAQGFAGSLATFPLLFLIKCDKKINKYIKVCEKKRVFDQS